MVALPVIVEDPTISAMRAAVEQRAVVEDLPRPYLGMSAVGGDCARKLWYSFRWAAPEVFDADTLWRFEDGHHSEDVMAARLRLVKGIHLQTIDPRTGKQFAYVDHGGHFRGHCDGLITGLVQAPSTLHVWEAKATNDRKHAALLVKLKSDLGEKNALEKWDAVYYAQAILYMAYAEAKRHYLTASTPGARMIVSVRTDTDLNKARTLRDKAERVIFSAEPLDKIAPGLAYQCEWCPAKALCYDKKLPAVNCRTCAHATPERDGDGRWTCALQGRDISTADQRKGCADHRYIPALVTIGAQVDASASGNWIEYRAENGELFRNGPPAPNSYSSEELKAIAPTMIGDATSERLRVEFGASHVGVAA